MTKYTAKPSLRFMDGAADLARADDDSLFLAEAIDAHRRCRMMTEYVQSKALEGNFPEIDVMVYILTGTDYETIMEKAKSDLD